MKVSEVLNEAKSFSVKTTTGKHTRTSDVGERVVTAYHPSFMSNAEKKKVLALRPGQSIEFTHPGGEERVKIEVTRTK